QYAGQYISDGPFGTGFTVLHRTNINGFYLEYFPLLVFCPNQVIRCFQLLAGDFRLYFSQVVQTNPASVCAYVGGNQMNVWMRCIVVLIEQIGLSSKAYTLHVLSSNLSQCSFRKSFARVKIQTDVNAVNLGA